MICGDIRNLTDYFKRGQFDACIAIDVIEHLPKEEGLKLMEDMESIAKRKIIIFTPNGFFGRKNRPPTAIYRLDSFWSGSRLNERA